MISLEKIRQMNDKELKQFIGIIAQRNNIFCARCNNLVGRDDKKTLSVSIYDKHCGQKAKKLCVLCNDCYTNLLDDLGIADVNWE